MLGDRKIHAPTTQHLRAAAAYLASARVRANMALRARLAEARGWRRAHRRQATILDDLQIKLAVSSVPLVDVSKVQVLPDYVLLLEFTNGERRRFSMAPYLAETPYNRLSTAQFALARIGYGTVVWPGGIDIDPETLLDLSTPA